MPFRIQTNIILIYFFNIFILQYLCNEFFIQSNSISFIHLAQLDPYLHLTRSETGIRHINFLIIEYVQILICRSNLYWICFHFYLGHCLFSWCLFYILYFNFLKNIFIVLWPISLHIFFSSFLFSLAALDLLSFRDIWWNCFADQLQSKFGVMVGS